MPDKFRVTHATWLATETERVRDILIGIKFWGVKWDHKRLQKELGDIGLNYSMAEIAELNDELHKRLIVEDITEAAPVVAEATDVV